MAPPLRDPGKSLAAPAVRPGFWPTSRMRRLKMYSAAPTTAQMKATMMAAVPLASTVAEIAELASRYFKRPMPQVLDPAEFAAYAAREARVRLQRKE